MRNVMCLLFITLIINACNDKPLIDSLCPCNFERERMEYADFSQKETILFYDSIPRILAWELREADIDWIIHFTKNDSSMCYSNRNFDHGFICNFPEKAKYWNIPYEGKTMICSIEAYRSCNSPKEGPQDKAYYDVIITQFKEK